MARRTRKDGPHASPVPAGGTDARASRGPRKDGRIKATLLLPPDLDRELAVVAAVEGKERSEVAGDALRMYLSKFRLVQALRRTDGPQAPPAGAAPAPATEGGSPGAGEGGD